MLLGGRQVVHVRPSLGRRQSRALVGGGLAERPQVTDGSGAPLVALLRHILQRWRRSR